MKNINQHPIFLGGERKTFDSLNKHYPKIFDLYKQQKAQDWSEDEFSYEQSRIDFERLPESVSGVMLEVLKWQWEADSEVAKSLLVAFAPFISDDTYALAITKQTEIEGLHALTYSEIVRQCVKNPEQVIEEIQNNPAVRDRMKITEGAFQELILAGVDYQVPHIKASCLIKDPLYFHKKILKGLFAVTVLEGLSFMASFACTFALDAQDVFQGIASSVQKIMLDEILHTKIDLEALKETLKDDVWKGVFESIKPEIKEMLDESVECEERFSHFIFSEGRAVVGLNTPLLIQWVHYNAAPFYDMFGIERDFEASKESPLPYMTKKMAIDKEQNANQEQQNGAYLLNTIADDVETGKLEEVLR